MNSEPEKEQRGEVGVEETLVETCGGIASDEEDCYNSNPEDVCVTPPPACYDDVDHEGGGEPQDEEEGTARVPGDADWLLLSKQLNTPAEIAKRFDLSFNLRCTALGSK